MRRWSWSSTGLLAASGCLSMFVVAGAAPAPALPLQNLGLEVAQ
jgi:hypothetical protein